MSKVDNVERNGINWYPGHMAKARREIGEAMSKVDLVFELVDARCPEASRNPILNELIGKKPRIIILNKADLADEKVNKMWIERFKKENQSAILADSVKGTGVKEIVKAAYLIMDEKLKKQEAKGMVGGNIKAMIVGIPNVGKSTLINKIAGKQTANTGNKPGVTKKNQWIRLDDRLQLLDTPGVLWPKLDDEVHARHLAYVEAIKDEVVEIEEIAVQLADELAQNYKKELYERFKIADDFSYEMPYELLEEIGRKRGCLIKGGEIDYNKAANVLIDEFRSGKIGRLSLERP
ncbi:MAG: ribosome biogenesis GTPase YlqF [Clostridia bacterium]|nr:ribosome biogenesis GTPase YlqF [Clostridia bacterium]